MSAFDSASKKIHNLLGMTTLGQKTKAASLGVTLASDETALGVTDNAGSLTIDSPGIPAALGQQLMAASMPAVIASNQSAIPVTDNAGSLTIDSPGIPTAKGQQVMTASMPVVLASDQPSITVDSPGVPMTLGQKAMAASMPVVVASDQTTLNIQTIDANTVLNVGSYLSVNKKTYVDIGATAHAYVAGDLIGAKITISAGTPASGGSGRLVSVLLVDKSNAGPDLGIIFWDADPISCTFTDGTSFATVSADQPKIVGIIKIAAADWQTPPSPKMFFREVAIPMRSVGARNLFAAIIALGTFTPGIAESLMMTLCYQYDNT